MLFLSCARTLGVPLVHTGMSGNFLSCLKDVKDPYVAQEGRKNFSRDAAVEKGHIPRLGENLFVLLELRWCSSRVKMRTSGTRLWGLREVQSPRDSLEAHRDSSEVPAWSEVLICS